jgi:hypothetical protein
MPGLCGQCAPYASPYLPPTTARRSGNQPINIVANNALTIFYRLPVKAAAQEKPKGRSLG